MPLMRLTLMPMSRAVVSLLEVARIAIPTREWRKKAHISRHNSASITREKICPGYSASSPSRITSSPSGRG
ncbi:hypothetical protein FQZ97_962550 [compost metagenome]